MSTHSAIQRRLALLLVLFAGVASSSTTENAPVAHWELSRYLGRWYEIAHLPVVFERDCVGDITATYTLQADGSVAVRNACRIKEGTLKVANGRARLVPDRPGALKVSFVPRWLSWIPWVWADYWVIDLDPDYRWAVVGSPSRKYLWFLSRTPTMTQERFEQLRNRAAQRGYDVNRLIVAGALN